MDRKIKIPPNLKDFRFIKTKEKIPIEKDWVINNNYSYDEMNIILEKTTTYGVLCGGEHNLLVIDIDKKEVNDELINIEPFKNTFITKTATKGFFHFYFMCDKAESFKCFDKDMNTVLDAQGQGKQVIGANSILSNGRSYEVYQDKPIVIASFDLIKSLLSKYDFYGLDDEKKQKKNHPNQTDEMIEKIKNKLSVKDLLNKLGVNTRKNPTECPFHSSKGGKCLSFTDKLWHCFHCGKEGDLITLYQEYYNKDFITTKEELKKISGIKEEKEKEDKLKEYKELNISKFIIFKSKDETQYKIFINNFYIDLNPDTLLTAADFRKKFFNETGKLLHYISNTDWCELINEWMADKGEMVDNTKDVNTDNIIVETILTEIQSFVVIKEAIDSASYGRLLYLDEEPDYVFVCNKVLDAIMKKNQIKVNMNKLRILLDDYVYGKSKIIRTGKVVHRFFRFKRCMLEDLDFDIEQINKTKNKYIGEEEDDN
jgi:hypothetical protein